MQECNFLVLAYYAHSTYSLRMSSPRFSELVPFAPNMPPVSSDMQQFENYYLLSLASSFGLANSKASECFIAEAT